MALIFSLSMHLRNKVGLTPNGRMRYLSLPIVIADTPTIEALINAFVGSFIE